MKNLNPLISTNRYIPLQYINILIGTKDFIVNTSKLATLHNPFIINPQTTPTIIENYIKKQKILPIITLKKEWIKENPIKIVEAIFSFRISLSTHRHYQNSYLL